MRSQLVLRRTRLFSKACSPPSRALLSYSGPARYPRNEQPLAKSARLSRRSSSTTTPSPDASAPESPPEANENDDDKPPTPPEIPEQPVKARTTRVTKESTKETDITHPLPNGLDILWTAESLADKPPTAPHPPPEIYEEALNNLWLTLHPQTQYRAAYSSSQGAPVEPTLALYCPIEGGDYVLDATVRELARQTESDVVVLDAVHLAAGECGQFGKAASVLNLPHNPLHFTAPPIPQRMSRRSSAVDEEDDDSDSGPISLGPPMSLTVLTPMRPSRSSPSSNARSGTLATKTFFEQLVNIQAPDSTPGRPRIIYVRDFGTLASSSQTWYPGLLNAVRARRQGPISRPTSPVANPVTIIFGIAPPLHSPSSVSGGGGGQNMMSLVMSRSAATSSFNSPAARPPRSEYGEDDLSDKARERRLRQRLRKWERADSGLLDDLPKLSLPDEDDEAGGVGSRDNGVVVVGGSSGLSGLSSLFSPFPGPSRMPSARGGGSSSKGNSKSTDSQTNSKFFRTTVIVPETRSVAHERSCRVARRREINELTMRMGVNAVGGDLAKMDVIPASHTSASAGKENAAKEDESKTSAGVSEEAAKMWEDWGKRLEDWTTVKQIADQAVGMVVSRSAAAEYKAKRPSLGAVPVPWEEVFKAWAKQRSTRNVRKAWMQKSSGKLVKEHEEDEEDEEDEKDETVIDEVVERVKRDPYLDQHEQRLLGCIVDAASMPTSFSQVHLPPHTIDSVRTIVSLPLLHPSSFQHGILKEHGMTGCLLFGPPGTGKTLIVRALAKEAGCRMLAVTPSDVMDMYVGEGEKLVRSLFSLARQLSPCVVFIDEIDALFGARSSARETGGAIAHRGVITEFMQEMDGLKSSKEDNVIVIGATNRPFDLDDAVLRRLPRRLLVDLPGEKEREEILKILLRDESLAPEVDLKELAKKTESFSGSDLKHLCVSAALDAVKEHVTVPWIAAPPPDSQTALVTDASGSAVEKPSENVAAVDAEATPSTPSEPNEVAFLGVSSSPDASLESESDSSTATAVPETAEATETTKAVNTESPSEEEDATPMPQRVLHPRNFVKALKEITPSSSESLGSLSELRKWNEEFGEGRKARKKQVWGKDRFGFMNQVVVGKEEGKVGPLTASIFEHIARSRDLD